MEIKKIEIFFENYRNDLRHFYLHGSFCHFLIGKLEDGRFSENIGYFSASVIKKLVQPVFNEGFGDVPRWKVRNFDGISILIDLKKQICFAINFEVRAYQYKFAFQGGSAQREICYKFGVTNRLI